MATWPSVKLLIWALSILSEFSSENNKIYGVTLDPRVNFHICVDEIVKKFNSRINILKILAKKAQTVLNGINTVLTCIVQADLFFL